MKHCQIIFHLSGFTHHSTTSRLGSFLHSLGKMTRGMFWVGVPQNYLSIIGTYRIQNHSFCQLNLWIHTEIYTPFYLFVLFTTEDLVCLTKHLLYYCKLLIFCKTVLGHFLITIFKNMLLFKARNNCFCDVFN